ncbi:MAG: Lrp/AsnC family transcriptional regulator [Candidatus Bathyarchaeota archaeon]|nr:Lrp/AsnC family transcriptional regulator [Candidatus Bathyarchaeota archaeon]
MSRLPDLDESDLKILMELQNDGRMNYAEISRRTGIPSSTVYDKITRLVNKGVIKKFTVILDKEKVGFGVSALIGVETGAQLYKNVAKELCQMHELIKVYGTTAEFDLMAKARTTSLEKLNEILNSIREIKGVDDIFVIPILKTFKDEDIVPLSESIHAFVVEGVTNTKIE